MRGFSSFIISCLLIGQVALLPPAFAAQRLTGVGEAVSKAAGKEWSDFVIDYPPVNVQSGQDPQLIKEGEYLVKIGDCISCHTNAREKGPVFGGGLPIITPFGTLYSSNISSDKETGIGKWSKKEFIRAMREGISPEGKYYFPAFPYPYFHKVTDKDLLAIRAYLLSIPPAKQHNKKSELIFPLNWRFLQLGWRTLFFTFYKEPYKYNAQKSAEWNRGAYLVEGLGHCAMCHTPMNIFGAPYRKDHLTGGFIDGFWAPNITKHGLQRASAEEVVEVFVKNKLIRSTGDVAGPMAEVNHNSLRYLTDNDLRAIVTYLNSVESHQENFAKNLAKANPASVGKKVFEARCVICHGKGNEQRGGAPLIGDAENWLIRLKQGVPKLYEHTIRGYNSMPVMGNCPTCSEENIKQAVDYLIARSLNPEQQRLAFIKKVKTPLTVEDGMKIYQTSCASCHDSGKNSAPRLDDKAEWDRRFKQRNFDDVVKSAIHGFGYGHVQANCATCSNAEVIAAVKYMVQKSQPERDVSLW